MYPLLNSTVNCLELFYLFNEGQLNGWCVALVVEELWVGSVMWAEGSDNHVKAFFFLRLLTIENSEFRISTSTYRIQHRRLSHPVRMFADFFFSVLR